MTTEQEKAMTRTAQRIAKKHRLFCWSELYAWVFEGKVRIGNIHTKFTEREKRRVKGMIPELRKKLGVTAMACKLGKESFVLDEKLLKCIE